MTEIFIELTEEEFDEQYPLVPNHINLFAGWAIGEDCGCLFETHSDELEFIKRHERRRIWTLVDGDDGHLFVVSGFHHVNRVGYLLSRDPIPDNTLIQVNLPRVNDDEGDRP